MQDDKAPWLVARAAVERLTQGIPVAALGVRSSRTADIARIARSSGHHAIWVDLEHSTMPIDTAALICAAALDLGLAPFARIPEREYGVIGRLLDGGVLGIIAPRVETAEEAQDIVAACRFPPFGHRSAVATLAHLDFQRMPAQEFNAAFQSMLNGFDQFATIKRFHQKINGPILHCLRAGQDVPVTGNKDDLLASSTLLERFLQQHPNPRGEC